MPETFCPFTIKPCTKDCELYIVNREPRFNGCSLKTSVAHLQDIKAIWVHALKSGNIIIGNKL